MDKKYFEAIEQLPIELANVLRLIQPNIQPTVKEIALRVNKPIALHTFGGVLFLQKNGQTTPYPTISSIVTTKQHISECVKLLTEYSLHSYKDKINNGYITINGGHRAGIVGSCSYNEDKLLMVNDISSINLRIARQIKGVARELTRQLFKDRVYSTLIVGSPCSGKTTLLRDMAYWLSSEDMFYKVAMIDQRGELASMKDGVAQNDTGILTDVLDGYSKGDGMRLAIRSMSPQVIILDEIGGIDDAAAIIESMNAGV